jgi:hypothetical protein
MSKSLQKIICLLPIIVLVIGLGKLKAQNAVTDIDELKTSFVNRVTELYQEKVFIHTDRSMYITGETIWLKPYCVDATYHTFTDLSKVVNIELFDLYGNVVKKERIQLKEGIGEGQIFVSPDLQTGVYELRAYTNWMKNFDSDYAFSSSLSIINPSDDSVVKGDVQVDSSNFSLDFFPEGGDLVAEIESKVAVKANDLFGTGIRLMGVVFDNEENEVAKFSTSQKGYASFQLKPQKGKTYKARIAYGSEIYKKDIPIALNSGLTLAVTTNNVGDYNVVVRSSSNFIQTMFLVIHTRGVIHKFEPLYPSLEQNINIEREGLEEGISHITILDRNFTPIAERLVFKYQSVENLIKLTTNKIEYSKREKVKLSIDANKIDVIAKMSVSVFRTDSSLRLSDNIVSSLLLTSDLKGKVINAADYFDVKNINKKAQLDLVMLTNGWRRFDWKQIANKKERHLSYPAEMNAPIISGKLKKEGDDPFPSSLKISFMGRSSFLNSTAISPDGTFHLEVPFRIKNEKAIFFIHNDTLNKNQIKLSSTFDFDYNIPQFDNSSINSNLKGYIETLNTNTQISQIYRSHNFFNGLGKESQKITSDFYGKPDVVYTLDNYTRFETVEDLFIEYIRFAYIKTKNKKKKFFVLNEQGNQVATLVTIDGVPVFDSEFILGFDPLKVEKVSMINNTYFTGDVGYSSLLSFTTYNGDLDKLELPESLVELAYDIIQSPKQFYSPNYKIDNNLLNRIPDYRNTLYWNPNISISNNSTELEFYTSDDPGLYKIQIEGITIKGIPFFSEDYISISEDSFR